MEASIMIEKSRLKFFPVSFFATVMGLAGTSIAFERLSKIFKFEIQNIYITLIILCTIWFLFLTFVYLMKFLKYPEEVKKDFLHPVKLNFIPTFSISLILFSIGYEDLNYNLALTFWILGTIIHFILFLYIVNFWFFKDIKINTKNPAWFIPAVGNILIPFFGIKVSPELSWFFFSAGIVMWIPLFSILLYRMMFTDPLPLKLMPTLVILVAPPAIGFISYIKITNQIDSFAKVLFYFGFFTFIMLLTFFKSLVKIPFYLSWWAYTFPSAAFTISVVLYFRLTQIVFFKYLSLIAFLLTTVLVLIVLIKTIQAATKGEICVED
ncbi:MAG: C4-dicarboxylate ABC transporter [Calditerrivibrio nitroreducens]|uniref:C4-dicarboxylate ABC transporter n=2 Tax=Calditerrivibrio TaxID=545865 RepID=A0A2J6WRC7_9BACT|nr:MAG: C4-dicarboxylate ABC transporter [Calditerrivibrio nitroreducens]